MGLLVLYLQDEEKGAINLQRVKSSSVSRDPLPQAGLQEVRQNIARVEHKQNLPLEVVSLLHALKNHGVTLVNLFKFFNV